MNNLGTLYGLGVGPGDPELITVKAFRVIQESPVIAYPKKEKEVKATPIASLKFTFVLKRRRCWALFFR